MLAYLIPIVAGCAVFLLFMLVFIRRDKQGNRGGRLAGCVHPDADEGCARCRHHRPVVIHPHPPDPRIDSADNAGQCVEKGPGHS